MSGHKQWADEEVLEAADVNGYLMDQVVCRFANATDRDAAIGTPAAGQLCYVTGLGLLQYNGTAWVRLVAVPAGGLTGQVLSKASDTDYDIAWTTPA